MWARCQGGPERSWVCRTVVVEPVQHPSSFKLTLALALTPLGVHTGAPLPAVRLPRGATGGHLDPHVPHRALLLRPRYDPPHALHVPAVCLSSKKASAGGEPGHSQQGACASTDPSTSQRRRRVCYALHALSSFPGERFRLTRVGVVGADAGHAFDWQANDVVVASGAEEPVRLPSHGRSLSHSLGLLLVTAACRFQLRV